LEDIEEEERQLDMYLMQMQEELNAMTKDPVYQDYAYMTF
jgi:hypothetical protein